VKAKACLLPLTLSYASSIAAAAVAAPNHSYQRQRRGCISVTVSSIVQMQCPQPLPLLQAPPSQFDNIFPEHMAAIEAAPDLLQFHAVLHGWPLAGPGSGRIHSARATTHMLAMVAEQVACAESLLMLAAGATPTCRLPSKEAGASAAAGPPTPWHTLEAGGQGVH
jgi:hypothetical protein